MSIASRCWFIDKWVDANRMVGNGIIGTNKGFSIRKDTKNSSSFQGVGCLVICLSLGLHRY